LVALKNDILAHQQEHPIIVWNDMIVDGRNRFRACEMLGRKPKIKEMQFADEAAVIAYIISTNMRRRHLTDEQRDQIGARLVTMQAGGDGGASPQNAGTVGIGVTAAAAMVHSTPARIERARTIERADPKLAEKVISGEISKGAALRQIKHAQERTKPLPAPTDYANADDSVIDKKDEANATGYTPKMEKVWASYSALDAVEQTAFRERMNG
jgi:ParB-like chromosome segregation protein Spo0J